jgi:hypothetical protein
MVYTNQMLQGIQSYNHPIGFPTTLPEFGASTGRLTENTNGRQRPGVSLTKCMARRPGRLPIRWHSPWDRSWMPLKPGV